jgi:SWI/SNF-related matrix-associated actin-dependent regulator 1 of chromatin subfamily A
MKTWAHQSDILPRLLAGNFILAWEPGVGKTLPLLQAGASVTGPQLYLGPASIISQVAREAIAFGTHTAVQRISSGKDTVDPKAQLVVCSYDLMAALPIWKQLFARKWGSLVLDEAHMLKNTAAKRTRAVYGARIDSKGALIRQAKHVWIATGTPILNDPMDLWTHVSRCFPQVSLDCGQTNRQRWLEEYCVFHVTPYGPKVIAAKNTNQLHTRLHPIMSRLLKKDVLSLPPLIEETIYVPAVELDHSEVPEDAMIALMALMAKPDPDAKELLKLEVPLASLRRQIGLAKAAHAADLATNALHGGSNKVLMFYQHTEVGKILHEKLTANHFNPVRYSGGLTQKQRNEVIHRFMTDPTCRVFIGQIQAAGTGLNLQAADRIFIVEPAWTPAVNEQAISRSYRGGQTEKVLASYVVLEKSVDEQVTNVLRRKSKLIKAIMETKND